MGKFPGIPLGAADGTAPGVRDADEVAIIV